VVSGRCWIIGLRLQRGIAKVARFSTSRATPAICPWQHSCWMRIRRWWDLKPNRVVNARIGCPSTVRRTAATAFGSSSFCLNAAAASMRIFFLVTLHNLYSLHVSRWGDIKIVCPSGSRRRPQDRFERNRRIKRFGYFGKLCVSIIGVVVDFGLHVLHQFGAKIWCLMWLVLVVLVVLLWL
jgi:hypothetical protein